MFEKRCISYRGKKLGQLFYDKNAQDAIDMLLAEFANVDAWSLATLTSKLSLGSMIVVLA